MKFLVVLLLSLCVAAVLGVLLYPVLMSTGRAVPPWVGQANSLAFNLGLAIKKYADDHGGRPPSALDELYPAYTSDVRATKSEVLLAGQRVVIKYHRPKALGNPKDLVLEIRPAHRTNLTGYSRPVRLWGDLHRPRTM